MRQDNYPAPVSDPEAEGLPDYADDDSTANDDAYSGREADGPDPAALPADRPLGVNLYGTTAEEARVGEPMDYKLAREVDDPAAHPERRPRGDDDDIDPDEALVNDTTVIEPNPNSPVSMYDIPDGTEPVGRIVEPDEGVREDVDKDAVAYDAGSAGGGATAEEAAMHSLRE
jgi:hypothetical protein